MLEQYGLRGVHPEKMKRFEGLCSNTKALAAKFSVFAGDNFEQYAFDYRVDPLSFIPFLCSRIHQIPCRYFIGTQRETESLKLFHYLKTLSSDLQKVHTVQKICSNQTLVDSLQAQRLLKQIGQWIESCYGYRTGYDELYVKQILDRIHEIAAIEELTLISQINPNYLYKPSVATLIKINANLLLLRAVLHPLHACVFAHFINLFCATFLQVPALGVFPFCYLDQVDNKYCTEYGAFMRLIDDNFSEKDALRMIELSSWGVSNLSAIECKVFIEPLDYTCIY